MKVFINILFVILCAIYFIPLVCIIVLAIFYMIITDKDLTETRFVQFIIKPLLYLEEKNTFFNKHRS